MGTSVDVGDAATTLEQSRAQAAATSKTIAGGALTAPDVTPAPPLQIGRSPQVKPSKGLGPPAAALTVPDATQPSDADSLPHGDLTPPPPPAPETTQAKPGTWDQSEVEFDNAAMRGYAELGRAVMVGLGMPAAAVADGVKSIFTRNPQEHNAEDLVGTAIDKVVNQAIDYWHPEHPEKSGLGAQVLGDVAGVIPALTLGPSLALPMLSAQAGANAGIESVNAGQDAKTAAILATTAVVSNALGMKIPLKSPNIWKRIGSSILGNAAISAGTQTLTKEILNSAGYKDAAAKIDLTDPRSILSTLAIAIGFGLHRQAGATPGAANKAAQDGTKVGQPPAPDTSQTAPDAGSPPPGPAAADNVQPPSPPPPAASTGPMPPQESGPGPVAKTAGDIAWPSAPLDIQSKAPVPDVPSIESSKDLRAQVRDMNDKATPRVGVLIAKDSLASIAGSKDANALSVTGTLNQARTQNRTIQLPQGELMLKSAKIAAATQARLDAGEDPQAVIGSVT